MNELKNWAIAVAAPILRWFFIFNKIPNLITSTWESEKSLQSLYNHAYFPYNAIMNLIRLL